MRIKGPNNRLPCGSMVFDHDRALGYWIALLGVPMLLALAAVLRVAPSSPMPAYLRDALQYANTGQIGDTTYPVEFAWFAGLSIRAFGMRGPEALQVLLYLLIVISVWALARKCGACARHALVAALIAAVYPQLVVSITKIWDVELAVLLMVLLMLLTVGLMRDGLRPFPVISLAVVFGLSLAQRSNMLLLFPLPAYFCLASAATWPRKIGVLLSAAALTLLTFAAVDTLAHGSFFLPRNGPYNLVQGHNEYTIRVMLQDLSCEPSVALIMKADGMNPYGFDETDPKLRQYFSHRAITYIRSHPLEELPITAVKLWTIFRPNTRMHRGIDLPAALILLMSLIFPAWIALLLWKARTGIDALDWTFIAAVALYVLPFLITSSDPRYQIPIEICLLPHMAYLTGRVQADSAANL